MDWDSHEIADIIQRALAEDIGPGDKTTNTLVPEALEISADFLAKESGVLAGIPLAANVFRRLDPQSNIDAILPEGASFESGTIIARVSGKARALLSGERVALNFLQRLCGIATMTSKFASLAAPYGIAILDTRKATPLLRGLEKYAVATGGGTNHRFALYDAVLVKDNHLEVESDFGAILDKFRKQGVANHEVEIEVTSPEMLERAAAAGVTWFLLDNMNVEQIRKCIEKKRPGMKFEISGGITLSNIQNYLIQGIDAISIGALTHSVRSLDISLEMHGLGKSHV